MADIFLSYTEHDRDTVRRLAETLQAVGWSVWWDRRIPAGQTWRSVLERELQSMHCMVVLWSTRSVKSDWVCEEAAEARQRDRLVPVLIEPVRPPAGFREVQAADLVAWDGARDFPGLQQLIGDIEQMIGKPGVVPRDTSPPPVEDKHAAGSPYSRPVLRNSKLLPWGAVASVLVIATGAYWFTAGRDRPPVISETHPPKAAPPSNNTPPPPLVVTPLPVPIPAAPPADAKQKPAPELSKANSSIAKGPDLPPRAVFKPVARQPPSSNPRCAALTERQALGETLSSESQSFFNQECRK